MTDKITEAFNWQSAACRSLGSPLTANVIDAVLANLSRNTRTGARILDWPGDPIVDALKLRIAGGLNALARSGQVAELSALYHMGKGDWAGVVGRALKEHDDWLYPWLDSAPQTNEVARSGVLYPGILEIARRFGPKIELLELGASGGLNMNMDRFGYYFGGMKAGDQTSPLQLAPQWEGPPPEIAPIDIVARRGADLQPLDMTDPAVANRMLAYIWPDQKERVARAEAAIAIARAHPPKIDAADGADWIETRLAEPQTQGVTRVIYHSIALQYFPSEGRSRVVNAIKAAGARATPVRPLAWLAMEFSEIGVTAPTLSLQCWPGGGDLETLAVVHPHGASISWSGPKTHP